MYEEEIKNHEKEKSQEEKILSGEDLKIESRWEKAFEIINSIKIGEDELKCIKHSLQYDNTSKCIIYRLLKYYYEKKDEKKYKELINTYKFCIRKKIKNNWRK